MQCALDGPTGEIDLAYVNRDIHAVEASMESLQRELRLNQPTREQRKAMLSAVSSTINAVTDVSRALRERHMMCTRENKDQINWIKAEMNKNQDALKRVMRLADTLMHYTPDVCLAGGLAPVTVGRNFASERGLIEGCNGNYEFKDYTLKYSTDVPFFYRAGKRGVEYYEGYEGAHRIPKPDARLDPRLARGR